MKDPEGASIAGVQFFVTQVLSAPDVPEKALVNIECARAHGVLSKESRIQQNANIALPGLREEFIAVFLNLVAELQGFVARCCGEVFAG